MSEKKIWIYGFHPVREVLLNSKNRKIFQILINEKAKERFSKDSLLEKHKHLWQITDNHRFDQFFGTDINHQNIAIQTEAPEEFTLDDFLAQTKNNNHEKIVILDQITDVGNIGSIIRSAVAFNFKYIFIPSHHSFSDYGTLAKASAGLIEKIKLIKVNNLNNLIQHLKKYEFWIIGLAGEAKSELKEINKFERLALILGNEHSGLRELIKKNCDLLVKIPINSEAESLNVANAAAIAFYQASN